MFTRFIQRKNNQTTIMDETIKLPTPNLDSSTSIEQALLHRKSTREFKDLPLGLADVSQLLWAGQGENRPGGYRTAPSAGALYPLEIYLLAGKVTGLPAGLYKYIPEGHQLILQWEGDPRQSLSKAALSQESIEEAPVIMILSAIYERTTTKYGERGFQYVHMEVGSVAQNIYLQATSLELGTVFIGAFYNEEVKKVLKLDQAETPLAIMPVGVP